MRRREFITLMGGAAVAWPLARARAAAGDAGDRVPPQHVADAAHVVTAFRQGLKDAGFVEGQNVAIEYRSADNQN